MSPNNPYQNQSGESVSLPPVGQPQPLPASVADNQPLSPTAVNDATSRAASEASRLVEQYANDPYRLSEELGRLKDAYIAEHYHIDVAGEASKN